MEVLREAIAFLPHQSIRGIVFSSRRICAAVLSVINERAQALAQQAVRLYHLVLSHSWHEEQIDGLLRAEEESRQNLADVVGLFVSDLNFAEIARIMGSDGFWRLSPATRRRLHERQGVIIRQNEDLGN